MSKKVKKGILFSLVTATISGFSIFYNRQIVVKSIDPLVFTAIKNTGVALLLSIIIFSTPDKRKLAKLTPLQWKRLFWIGIIGGSIPFILFFQGLKHISAINATLIHKTLFLWVAAIAIPFLGERLNTYQVLGYLLIVFSNFYLGGFSGFSGSLGEVMVFVATLFWAIENIIAKVILKEVNSKIVAWGRMFIGSLILLAVLAIEKKLVLLLSLSPDLFFPIMVSILLLSGYVLSWYKALQLAPATLVTSVLILATPITNILTAIFKTHTFSQREISSILFTIIGALLIVFISFMPIKLTRQLKMQKSRQKE